LTRIETIRGSESLRSEVAARAKVRLVYGGPPRSASEVGDALQIWDGFNATRGGSTMGREIHSTPYLRARDGVASADASFAQVRCRRALLGTSALSGGELRSVAFVAALAAAPALAPSQAAAQFVCSDTQTGTGQGAAAGPNSVACGTGASAGGDGSISNTATGANANASGSGNAANGIGNTATGDRANASGDGTVSNTATGNGARSASVPTLMATPATTSRSVPRPSPAAVR
jgi:hypothetical protein